MDVKLGEITFSEIEQFHALFEKYLAEHDYMFKNRQMKRLIETNQSALEALRQYQDTMKLLRDISKTSLKVKYDDYYKK